MALKIETVLMCDGCKTVIGQEDRNRTGMKQRHVAKQNGWMYSGGKDYCPNCIPSKNKPAAKQPRAGRPPQNNFYLQSLCKQLGVSFTNARFVSHASLEPEGTRVDAWDIHWPKHKLDGQIVYRIIRTPKRNGQWGKSKTAFCLGETNSPEFSTLELFIEHYANI